MPKFVITGASGAGKSSLIAALAAQGYATVPEAGRQIVAEQVTRQGSALPWLDQAAFMDLLFARSIAAFDHTASTAEGCVFFDRSFLEAIAYGTVIARPAPETMLQAAHEWRFANPVFVCPPWRFSHRTANDSMISSLPARITQQTSRHTQRQATSLWRFRAQLSAREWRLSSSGWAICLAASLPIQPENVKKGRNL